MEVLYKTEHTYSSIHLLELGTSQGVIKYTNENFDEYWNFVERRKREFDMSISEDERTVMAAIDWIVDKTHEFGGIAIFCHPFWRPECA